MKRLVLSLLFCCLLPFSAMADGGSAKAAGDFIADLGKKALVIAQDKKVVGDARQQRLEGLFTGYVDIDWVSKFVLGRYWKQATDAQKTAYTRNYKSFLLKHYTSKFSDYAGETFKILKTEKDAKEGQYIVTMEIDRSKAPGNQANVIVDYRVRAKDGSYKIFDIIVEGVSLITTQRSEFASVVSQKGLDHLIEQLGKKADGAAKAKS